MPIVRMRITGAPERVDAIVAALHGIDKVDRVEEVIDEVQTMRDDSSSSGLPDDTGGQLSRVEIHASGADVVERVHGAAEILARDLDCAIEIVDRF
jgi:hypothetical protein